MNKRKFQLRFGLLAVAIIGILAYRVFTVETKNKESLKAISQINKTDEMLGKDNEKDLVTKKSAIPQYSENEMNTILEVLQPHMFHEDSYIEAKLLFELKNHCRYKRSKLKFKCDEVKSRHNQLEGLLIGFQDLKQIPSNSKIGKALKNRMSYDLTQAGVFRHQTRLLLQLIINSNNSFLLVLEGPVFMFDAVDNGEILPISEWLNSQDQEYNRVVLMYALLKMAHQYETSQSDGFVNQMLCNSNRLICGVEFKDTYHKLVLPGMRKDVDVMISHLVAFAAE